MKKTFLAAALVASLCVPAYAAQYTNHGDNRFELYTAEHQSRYCRSRRSDWPDDAPLADWPD